MVSLELIAKVAGYICVTLVLFVLFGYMGLQFCWNIKHEITS